MMLSLLAVLVLTVLPVGRATAATREVPAREALAVGEPFADADDPQVVTRGRAIYAVHCASCHGSRLEGQPNWRAPRPGLPLPAPPHDASGHTWQHSDRELLTSLQEGAPGLAEPGAPPDMPSFADVLQDNEMLAVLAFIKSTWPPYVRAAQALLNPNARGFPLLPEDADWTLPGECSPEDAAPPPGARSPPADPGRTSSSGGAGERPSGG